MGVCLSVCLSFSPRNETPPDLRAFKLSAHYLPQPSSASHPDLLHQGLSLVFLGTFLRGWVGWRARRGPSCHSYLETGQAAASDGQAANLLRRSQCPEGIPSGPQRRGSQHKDQGVPVVLGTLCPFQPWGRQFLGLLICA